jgi:hypothetical protein
MTSALKRAVAELGGEKSCVVDREPMRVVGPLSWICVLRDEENHEIPVRITDLGVPNTE